MLLLSVTIFLAIAAAALALRLVIVCCRRSSAMITTLPQAVTEEGEKATFDYITVKTITPGPDLQILPVARVSRAAVARRSATNHANTDREDPAMLNVLAVYFNWKQLATDPNSESEFEVNCKAVPATD